VAGKRFPQRLSSDGSTISTWTALPALSTNLKESLAEAPETNGVNRKITFGAYMAILELFHPIENRSSTWTFVG
jgi:hypothetical protein